MAPVPSTCLLCASPLKNSICPSCGWNPAAPDPGKTEAQILEEKRRSELRALLVQDSPAPAAAPSVPDAVQQSASDPDADLRGYLLGLGYNSDAIPAILAKNGDAIRASFQKAQQQQRSAAIAAVPQVSTPPVGAGWRG